MSLFTTAFKLLTGGNKNVDKIVDGAINGIDKAWYTEQERAAHYTKFVEQQIDENSIRSRARRVLAFAIGLLVWALSFGSVLGPTLGLGLLGGVAESLGLSELAGPYLLA